MNINILDDWITTTEAARRLDVEPVTIRSWVAQGQLKARRLGRDLVINELDFSRLAAERAERLKAIRERKMKRAAKRAA